MPWIFITEQYFKCTFWWVLLSFSIVCLVLGRHFGLFNYIWQLMTNLRLIVFIKLLYVFFIKIFLFVFFLVNELRCWIEMCMILIRCKNQVFRRHFNRDVFCRVSRKYAVRPVNSTSDLVRISFWLTVLIMRSSKLKLVNYEITFWPLKF